MRTLDEYIPVFIREGKVPKNVKLMLLAIKNISEMYFIKITFTQY